ncbi:MAG TPA: hypothetical protein DCM28_01955 [Phycisphaerales bacterium]|nr:hypothetical protein [Phycisphaerales bacterium]HCD32780.1 hypothetical protein [Phycisphaerales bacterium]|tara:strand:- start:248 stop:511 length:264 start_codon:yes stop_codon:yes gene_type:complete
MQVSIAKKPLANPYDSQYQALDGCVLPIKSVVRCRNGQVQQVNSRYPKQIKGCHFEFQFIELLQWQRPIDYKDCEYCPVIRHLIVDS